MTHETVQRKIAVITGAARGIGRATALCLAKKHYSLGILDQAEATLALVGNEVKSLGATVVLSTCSVTDETSVARAYESVASTLGGIDVLINCAGLAYYASVQDTPSIKWRQILEVNLTGTFICCREALPWLIKRGGGQIINLISVGGKQIFTKQAAYCASKWGALAFTRVLASEVRNQGIRVTALCPGAVDTPLWDTLDQRFDRLHMLRPERVAETISFILSQPHDVCTDEIEIMPPSGVL